MKIIKTYIRLILCFSIIVILNSCKKETEKEPIEASSVFTIGVENNSVNVTKYNPALVINATGNVPLEEYFDIGTNGINDMVFKSINALSPGGVSRSESSISVINGSFKISAYVESDSTFECEDTINNQIYFYNNTNYSCQGNNTFISTSTFTCPNIYNQGDIIDSTETWLGNDMVLSYINNSFYWTSSPQVYYSINRGPWNNQQMKYILFKKESNRTYYGWIKISINNYKEITLYEYAIEK